MKTNILRTLGVGFLMGTADVIPGVSGGTIAFITGIYDTLIESLAHINKHLLHLIYKKQFAGARAYINGTFLVQLFSGIILAILLLAKTMTYLLASYPQFVFAFFLGLIVASIFFIGSHIHTRRVSTVMALISGVLIGYGATGDTTFIATSEPGLISVLFAGAFASMAMILPGISGSYILVLLGKYAYILEVLSNRMNTVSSALQTGSWGEIFGKEFVVISTFVGGIMIGLLGFSRVLQRLLTHHRSYTLAVLVGCMIGTLHILWPWETGMSMNTGMALVLLVGVGAGIVFLLSRYAPTKKTTS